MTKFFVVAAAVLTIALSALVVSYAVNTDRVVADYRRLMAEKTAVDAQMAAQAAQASQRQAELNAQLESLRQGNSQIARERTTLQAERATLIGERNRAESARQALEANIAELSETQKSLVALVQTYREEVIAQRDNELSNRRAMLDMEDRINDLESQREVLEANVRQLQEQLTEARRMADAAVTGAVVGLAAANQPFIYSGPVINGRIEQVMRDAGSGLTMAKISVGTNDRVARNMVFYITRGTEFLGRLTISETDLGWSIGRIDTLGRPVTIQSGDTIQTRL